MKTRDIVIGFMVLVILVAGVLWVKKVKTNKILTVPTSTPGIQKIIEEKFGRVNIPDTEKAELKDVSGLGGMGIATRTEVLADLPDPETGPYQVWVDGKLLGKMRIAKGGWIFDGKINGQKVEVKLGAKTILEGSF